MNTKWIFIGLVVLLPAGCTTTQKYKENQAQIAAAGITSDIPLPDYAQGIEGYVGSKACKICHRANYDGWKTTYHSKYIQDPKAPGALVADFSIKSKYRTFEQEDVDLLIGSRFKQRFMKRIGNDYYMFPAQWNVATKEWVKYFPEDEWWCEYYPRDWKQRPNSKLCDGCHTVGLMTTGDKFIEWNIACEQCHGPGKEHAYAPSVDNIINPAKLPFDKANDVCFDCHEENRIPTEFWEKYGIRDYPVGYKPGDDLIKYKLPAPFVPGKESNVFFPSGIGKKNRTQGNDFIRSTMYRRGIKCFTCHNLHNGRYTAMVYKPGNELCLTCHGEGSTSGPYVSNILEHTHHKPDSPGSQCIECHMPKIGKNALELESRSHAFNFEYFSPEQTILYGQPNACNRCHQDKTPEWALETLKSWGGKGKWAWGRALLELSEMTKDAKTELSH
ncbi:MAG: cytochrome C [Planctomycetes bacterium]|nr:cytochrome C [Planctomycetota bacterium]